MGKPKFTRARIWEILQSGAGLDNHQARDLTARIIDDLAAALAAGETVELRDFGSFELRERKAHKARNPRTGETVIVPARRYVFFTPGRKLKMTLREPAHG